MLKQYVTIYKTKNYAILKKRVSNHKLKYHYFIEIKDNGKLILKNSPRYWNDRFFNENNLEETEKAKIVKIPSDDDPDDFFEVAYLKYQHKLFVVGKIFEETDDLLELFSDLSLMLFALILIIGLTGGYLITSKLLFPLNQLLATINEIADNRNFSLRIPIKKNTSLEFAELIQILNFLLERIEKLINGMKDSLDYVAHDLKTPITRLKHGAYSILTRKNSKVQECKEALIKAIEESDEIVRMLDSIMALSEAESNSIKLNFENIDLKMIFNEIMEMYELIGEERNIVIKNFFIGDCKIKGDKHLLGRAIANLMDNAIKYSFENSEIICSVKEKDNFIIIKIKDNGIGIGKREINKIFEKLYREDKSRHTKGHGLGLALVKAIIEIHNGTISVISEKSKGSTFTIKLPKS
jgi:signal transduction histidine kinase